MNNSHLRNTSAALAVLASMTACAPTGYKPAQNPSQRIQAQQYIEKETSSPIFYFKGNGGDVLAGHRYPAKGSPRHVVIAFHGLAVAGSSFAPVAHRLAADGFEFWCPDRRGLGLNRGGYFAEGDVSDWKILLHDADAAIRHVQKARPGVPIHLLGISMGSSTAIHCASGTVGTPLNGIKSVHLIVPPLVLAPALRYTHGLLLPMALANPFGTFYLDTSKFTAIANHSPANAQPDAGIQYLKYLAETNDVMRITTNRGLQQSLRLITSAAGRVDKVHLPVSVVLGGKDELVDSVRTKALLERKASRYLQGTPIIEPGQPHNVMLTMTPTISQWFRKGALAAE